MEASDRDIERTVRNHDRSFQRRFPMLKKLEMEYRWGGRLCLSWNGVPVFGEIEDGLFAACCQNGVGVSKGTLSGILAAEYASGFQNSYIEDYLNEEQPARLPLWGLLLTSTGRNGVQDWKSSEPSLLKLQLASGKFIFRNLKST